MSNARTQTHLADTEARRETLLAQIADAVIADAVAQLANDRFVPRRHAHPVVQARQPAVPAVSHAGTRTQLADAWARAALVIQMQQPAAPAAPTAPASPAVPAGPQPAVPAAPAAMSDAVQTQLAASRPYRETIELVKAGRCRLTPGWPQVDPRLTPG